MVSEYYAETNMEIFCFLYLLLKKKRQIITSICSGAQLKDFIQRCKVTVLKTYYNHPAELDALKYTDFVTKYNTLAKLPK